MFGTAFADALRTAVVSVGPWVTEYLTRVSDRLAPTLWPAQVFEEIRYELLEGVDHGESIEELRDRVARTANIDAPSRAVRAELAAIEREIDDPNTPAARREALRAERRDLYRDLDDADYQWHYQARRVARTEAIGALNGGAYFGTVAYAAETGDDMWKQWLGTNDARIRESHRYADGQVQPLADFFSVGAAFLLMPGDPNGPADEVIQCRCTTLYLTRDEADEQARRYAEIAAARPALTAAANGDTTMEAIPDAVLKPIDYAESEVEPELPEHWPHIPWDGPLAQVGHVTEDRRRLREPENGEVLARPFPLALKYQEQWEPAHMGAVLVGRIDSLAVDGGELVGEGLLNGRKLIALDLAEDIEDGMAGWVSIDLADFDVEELEDDEGGWFVDYTRWVVDGATLLPGGQAMANARIRITPAPGADADDAAAPPVLVASVSGSTDLPLAEREHPWDSDSANTRLVEWASTDDGLDGERFGQAHFWRDADADPALVGSYKLPFADVIDGTLTAIPEGVISAANVLSGGMGGVDIPETDVAGVKARVAGYYERMNMTPPWEDDDSDGDEEGEMSAREAAGVALTASSAAVLAEPFIADPSTLLNPPAAWFDLDEQLLADFEPSCYVTVTDEGRVYGYVGARDTPHLKYYPVTDVYIPKSASGYGLFMHGPVVHTRDRGAIRVGTITMGTDHASEHMGLMEAMRHYDDTGHGVASVRAYDTERGVVIFGALDPGATKEQVYKLRARAISGDWRPTPQGLEMCGVLVVNSGGFARVRRMTASSVPHVLIASLRPAPRPGVLTATPGFHIRLSGAVKAPETVDVSALAATLEAAHSAATIERMR